MTLLPFPPRPVVHAVLPSLPLPPLPNSPLPLLLLPLLPPPLSPLGLFPLRLPLSSPLQFGRAQHGVWDPGVRLYGVGF